MIELFSLFSPTKTAPPQEKLFFHIEAGNSSISGATQRTNTKLAPMCY